MQRAWPVATLLAVATGVGLVVGLVPRGTGAASTLVGGGVRTLAAVPVDAPESAPEGDLPSPAPAAASAPQRAEAAPVDSGTGEPPVRAPILPPRFVKPGEGKLVTFTFDDGSRNASEGARLFDLLSRLEIPSILFPTGRWERAHPDLAERARRDGHLICNHSSTHANLSVLADVQIEAEILAGAGIGSCNLLRPPSMGIGPRVEKAAAKLGYRLFLWDVDSRDWEGYSAEDITNLVLARVFPGAVVLFHMHSMATLQALPTLASRLRNHGYVIGYPTTPEGLAALDPGRSSP